MSKINVGPEKFETWSASSSYLERDIVLYEDVIYKCIFDNPPASGITEPTYWIQISDLIDKSNKLYSNSISGFTDLNDDENPSNNILWSSEKIMNSPEFYGQPQAPTPEITDYSNQLATTEFVQNLLNNYIASINPVSGTSLYTFLSPTTTSMNVPANCTKMYVTLLGYGGTGGHGGAGTGWGWYNSGKGGSGGAGGKSGALVYKKLVNVTENENISIIIPAIKGTITVSGNFLNQNVSLSAAPGANGANGVNGGAGGAGGVGALGGAGTAGTIGETSSASVTGAGIGGAGGAGALKGSRTGAGTGFGTNGLNATNLGAGGGAGGGGAGANYGISPYTPGGTGGSGGAGGSGAIVLEFA